MSAIDRIKAKALAARNVAREALTSFEGELDSILAEKEVIKRRVAEASAPHHEILKGIHGEIDGLKSAIDLLSNGGPPLEASPTVAPGSEHPIEHYHDPSYIEQVKK